jgi:hypothetical protein
VAPTGVETERSPDIDVLLRQIDTDSSMQLYCYESSQQIDEMDQSFMTPEQIAPSFMTPGQVDPSI